MTDVEERVILSGPLSIGAEFRLVIKGDWTVKECERLISQLSMMADNLHADECGDANSRIINLAPEDFEEFSCILETPPAPNDRLVTLLRGYTITSQKFER